MTMCKDLLKLIRACFSNRMISTILCYPLNQATSESTTLKGVKWYFLIQKGREDLSNQIHCIHTAIPESSIMSMISRVPAHKVFCISSLHQVSLGWTALYNEKRFLLFTSCVLCIGGIYMWKIYANAASRAGTWAACRLEAHHWKVSSKGLNQPIKLYLLNRISTET